MEPIWIAALVVSIIGIIAALLLSLASRYMSVPVDEKAEKIRACLPGANCGGCGYAGCDGYADALAKNPSETPDKCTAGGSEVIHKLNEILGTSCADVEPKVAHVFCQGDCKNTGKKSTYQGVNSCKAVALYYGGDGDCSYGCLGYGDCGNVCPSHAIHIVNGVAVVDTHSCLGCGVCVKTCPKHLIALTKPLTMHVNCQNRDKGPDTKAVCNVGCIGCGICLKKCEAGAITLTDNHAVIDPVKCTNCGACRDACPVHAIF